MRLFVAAWPSPEVVALIAALPRPELAGVRWTTPAQWHVTLRFYGNVADDDVGGVVATMRRSLVDAGVGVVQASLRPPVRRFGRTLGVPVEGLDPVAAVVDPGAARAFRGHLTLARFSSRRPPRCEAPEAAAWPVDEVTLVRSHLGRGPARYEIVERVPLLPHIEA
jgi:RNA 2',3'-cyclic 3'-phosphodiesterase